MRLLDFYANKSWAILEANLQEMYQIYRAAIERKASDMEFDPQAVAARLGRPLQNTRSVTMRENVAVLPVTGPLMRYANIFTEISGATSIEILARDFTAAMEDPSVRAIVLEINSPGGEVDGTSELAQMIFSARDQKPIVGYVSNLAASAGYWLASACDEIVCADTAALGSIGVVGAVRTSKDENMVEFVSSQSPNKRPDPHTESGKAQLQAHVDELADVFIQTVATNRGMTPEAVVEKGGAGGLKVGRRAVEAGLADRVGTLESVIEELTKNVNQKAGVRFGAADKPTSLEGDIMADKKLDTVEEEKPKADEKPEAKPEANSDPQAKPDIEAKAEEYRQAAELAQAEALAAKAELEKTNKRIDELEKSARASRFNETAKDWTGDRASHVDMLEFLATSCGEDSERFKNYITQQNATAEQLKDSILFREVGSNAPAEGSASAMVEAKARKLAEESAGKLTYEQAYDKVLSLEPSLAREVFNEERVN